MITAKQETPVATATGPETRSSYFSDDATLFDYSGTDSEYIAGHSDNEETYDTDNNQVEILLLSQVITSRTLYLQTLIYML